MNKKENKIKAAIFPYDSGFTTICQYEDLLKIMEITQVLSLPGWGMLGRKVQFPHKELEVQDIYGDIEQTSFDALWVVESLQEIEEEVLLEIINHIVKCRKKIIFSRKIKIGTLEKIKEICKKEQESLYLYPSKDAGECLSDEAEYLYNLNTPIVAVCGLGERTNKLEIQLHLWKKLICDEYKVCWISSGNEAEFFGGISFPQFMLEKKYSEKEKILLFNHFLKFIEQTEEPDIFVIGIPGSIMPISKKQVDYFGITAFEVFSSIEADFVIQSIYYGEFGENYLQELKEIMKYRFNAEVDIFYMSNVEQDMYTLDKMMPVEYLVHGDEKQVSKRAGELSKETLPVFSRATQNELYKYLINRLSEYDELKVF